MDCGADWVKYDTDKSGFLDDTEMKLVFFDLGIGALTFARTTLMRLPPVPPRPAA